MTFGYHPVAGLRVNPSIRCLLIRTPTLRRPVSPTPAVPLKPLSPQLHHPLSHSFDSAKLFPGRKRPRRGRRRYRLFPSASSASLELPLLPFNGNEVLVPSESKVLHLYEARYLALLEESLSRENLFVHFVLKPIYIPGSTDGTSFEAKYGCLVLIEKVERLDVGALVSIRGVCRVKLLTLYRQAVLSHHCGIHFQKISSETSSKVHQLKESLCNLIKLEIKLRLPRRHSCKHTQQNSLRWAETTPSVRCDESFIPPWLSEFPLQPAARYQRSRNWSCSSCNKRS
ncbi:Lon N-terminal domain-containing protein [Psidium guajava]|nr:Lon N-terminal domain-containing protein [Psidium guajava]